WLAGSVSGTVALGVQSASLSGNLRVSFNTGMTAINESFAGNTIPALILPAGPFVRIEGTNVNLTIAGQTLTGNFSFEQATRANGTPIIRVAATAVHLTLGG